MNNKEFLAWREQAGLGFGLNSDLLAFAAEKRGMATDVKMLTDAKDNRTKWLTFSTAQGDWAYRQGKLYRYDPVNNTLGSHVNGELVHVTSNKSVSKLLVENAGVRVPKGIVLQTESPRLARITFGLFNEPVCVKPLTGAKGDAVFVGVDSLGDFKQAFKEVGKRYNRALVEQHIAGDVLRVTMVAGKVAAARVGVPPVVIGDDSSTVLALIEALNEHRKASLNPIHKAIKVDDAVQACLRKQRLTLESVPATSQVVKLRETSNIALGGESVDVMSRLHPDYLTELERIPASVNGELFLMGVDVIVPQLDVFEPEKYGVIELNSSPGLAAHAFPWQGQGINLGNAILEALQ